jgi:hypothetical protein
MGIVPPLTTAEAAARLTARGVLVCGGAYAPHPPTAKNVEKWCRRGWLKAEHVGSSRRGFWLIEQAALDAFTPPIGGRPRKAKDEGSE